MSEFFDTETPTQNLDEDTFDQGVDLHLWRKLLGYALNYPADVIMLSICAIVTAISEIAFPLITRQVIDKISEQGAAIDIMHYGSLYLIFVVVLATSVAGFIWFGGRIRTQVSYDIRQDGFKNLQQLSFSYYDFRPVGWLMARMTSDCERLSNILAWGLLDIIWCSTMILGITAAMIYMNTKLALIILAVLPFLAVLSIFFQRHIIKSARKVRKTNSKITGYFNESIMGVKTTKAFVQEQNNLSQFSHLTGAMYHASVLNRVQAALYLPLVLILGAIAAGLALVFGGMEVIWGTITAGTLIAFLTYSRHFFEPIEELARWFAEMQMAQASAERILGLIDAKPAISDSTLVTTNIRTHERHLECPAFAASASTAALDGLPLTISRIEFRQVCFSYPNGPRVLDNINLTIQRGDTIAIVGTSGGGKTSLINLLCRFYEPSAGNILLDNIDYRNRSLSWLQSNLGMVLQTSHIFRGSILDNIRYGNLSANTTEIKMAARRAGADIFIQQMEYGYSTEVGEGGAKLSAGEKQLISIARAILANPQILILDEATSSIDLMTEETIQHGLAELFQNRISLVIAHRLSTVRNANTILVVEKGKIVQRGNHTQLLKMGGRYQQLYQQQNASQTTQQEKLWVSA